MVVPEVQLKSRGNRAFALKALWNELPEEMGSTETVTCFKSLLKVVQQESFPSFTSYLSTVFASFVGLISERLNFGVKNAINEYK